MNQTLLNGRFGIFVLVLALLAPQISPGKEAIPLVVGPRLSVKVVKNPGHEELIVDGGGPHFWSQPLELDPTQSGHTVLAFEYFSPDPPRSLSVRYRDRDGKTMQFAGSRLIPISEAWTQFSIPLSTIPAGYSSRLHFSFTGRTGTSLKVRNLRLRPPTAAELAAEKNREMIMKQRELNSEHFLRYLGEAPESRIHLVSVGKEKISIHWNLSSEKPARLVELPPHLPDHASPANAIPIFDIPANANDSVHTVSRFDPATGRDRALSRWRIDQREGKVILSHAKWPTTWKPEILPPDVPDARLSAASQKGIGGVPPIKGPNHPIFELGVDHATINFVLNALVSHQKRPGNRPFQFEGRTFYFNPNYVSRQDATIRHLRKKGIIVTAILLVGNNDTPMAHPAAQPRGKFAMPNLQTAEGSRLYRAALDFIAKRYTSDPMAITNWVIHNEVDQAGTWTNMGDQPMARYVETYARSTRLVFHTMRLRDPHARVFISLTHHWAKQSSGEGTYTVKKLVDLFTRVAEAGGSGLAWGVAYHPYPRDLRNPDTWNDRDVTFDFETPYITPKNLEVLPAYLGPDRPILLSEQGFNTPTLSIEDQKRQVAGLIYLFRKLPHFPTIEAFHLHRYQDMPDAEGGLRLGIMDENGNRKLGWHAYTAIGTDQLTEHEAIADELLPPREPIREIPPGE